VTSRSLGILAFFRRWLGKPVKDTGKGCLLTNDEIQDVLEEIDELRTWRDAVVDACVVNWVPEVGTPRDIVRALLANESRIALDPAVSEEAAKLHARIGVLESQLAEQTKLANATMSSRLELLDKTESLEARLEEVGAQAIAQTGLRQIAETQVLDLRAELFALKNAFEPMCYNQPRCEVMSMSQVAAMDRADAVLAKRNT
jgi:hypothetical protein